MAAVKWSLFFLLFVFISIGDVDCECLLDLNKDFSRPSPVLIHNDKYLHPEICGAISVRRSDVIVIGCPGGKKSAVVLGNTTSSYDVLEAHCISGSTFRVDRWIGSFDQIKCTSSPFFESKLTNRRCIHGGKIYEIGYKIRNKLYRLYEACYDEDRLSSHYVKHEILPTTKYIQQATGTRPTFIEGGLFKKVKMSQVYKTDNVKNRIDAILGPDMSQNYVTKKQFLTRGHLAARADFTLQAEMRATFHYVNTAPQWQRGNAGDWAALEDALRRRVHSLGRAVTVFTGTHGTFSLPARGGVWRPLHLHADENNNGLVPVPLYFYKLVYDSQTKNATAFVSINSSHYNASTVRDLTFCDDLCTENELSWLVWRANDGTHSFCCDYEEFTNKVGRIEELDVRGPFY